jgi:hypothetical protein
MSNPRLDEEKQLRLIRFLLTEISESEKNLSKKATKMKDIIEKSLTQDLSTITPEQQVIFSNALAHYIDQAGVKKFMINYPGVEAIHDLHIWGLSTREVALTVHLVMPQKPLTDSDFKKINGVLHHDFHINHATIQVENGSIEDPCLRSERC